MVHISIHTSRISGGSCRNIRSSCGSGSPSCPCPRLLPPLRHLQSLESLLWLATERDRGKGERRGSGRKTARGQWNGEREERRGRTLWTEGVRLGRRNEPPSTTGRLGID